MADLERWIDLWEQEPKLRPAGLTLRQTEHLAAPTLRRSWSIALHRRWIILSEELVAVLIRDQAEEWLLSVLRETEAHNPLLIAFDGNKYRVVVYSTFEWYGGQTGLGETRIDAFYSACKHVLDQMAAAT